MYPASTSCPYFQDKDSGSGELSEKAVVLPSLAIIVSLYLLANREGHASTYGYPRSWRDPDDGSGIRMR